jgi:hypothetical protein
MDESKDVAPLVAAPTAHFGSLSDGTPDLSLNGNEPDASLIFGPNFYSCLRIALNYLVDGRR